MASLSFLIAPGVPPQQTFHWYRLNLVLQKILGQSIHLHLALNPNDFLNQLKNRPALTYVNSYDTSQLIREYQYLSLVRPKAASDEVVIFTDTNSALHQLSDINQHTQFICLSDISIEKVGQILLEPSGIEKQENNWRSVNHYQTILRLVSGSQNTVGIMRANDFKQLSATLQKYFRPIVTSSLSVLCYTILLSPTLAKEHGFFHNSLLKLNEYPDVLKNLGFYGIQTMNQEVGLFICDIIDTLN